ncbi:MAG TPA: type I-U CRISPR-associated helicase/endonuclease Cas3 [Acidisarcina sp.]
MTEELGADDFEGFFQEIHGYGPFPWQSRLARRLADGGGWPEVLDLPTGSGKTAALDIAVFHLALEAGAERLAGRRAPVRIALVVDRRLVVDDAFNRAKKIACKLRRTSPGSVTAKVALRLKLLAGAKAEPLLARRLRGGVPREDDWARTPSQPTILCSTVDQVGSRLLFRGYGVSDSMKPVHAGLLGSDCLILLDEAHLSEPFRQTLRWVQRYKGESWRESRDSIAPWGTSLLTATPGPEAGDRFGLEDEDRANPTLQDRLNASKCGLLVAVSKAKKDKGTALGHEKDGEPDKVADQQRVDELVMQAVAGLEALRKSGIEHPAIAVVTNRVARARAVFEKLLALADAQEMEAILMIGPSRSVDRDELAIRLEPIKTSNPRELEKALMIVSTQCIEAGVDIDLDGLITEAAPIDSLRQRFGRLNRAGRWIAPYAAIIGSSGKADANDPVYGEAIVTTWKYLTETADRSEDKKNKQPAEVDFGIAAFGKRELDKSLLSPKEDAPILLPAHLDLLSFTSPIPTADPDVSLYLHGPSRSADSVSVIWRGDIDPRFAKGTYRLMELVRPRPAEAIELPVWAVRRWLTEGRRRVDELADIASKEPEESGEGGRLIYRWTGKEESSGWIHAFKIRPGDTVMVPAAFGGVDEFGWNPSARKAAKDVASQAAGPYEGRRFAVRVAPGLLNSVVIGSKEDGSRLAQAIAGAETRRWKHLRDAVLGIGLSPEITEELGKLDHAKGTVEVDIEVYGRENDCPRGVVFIARLGIKSHRKQEDSSSSTENDLDGSLAGLEVSLQRHSSDVEEMAAALARRAGLSVERIADLKLAGHLHDAGKADPRFQRWMAYGDPLGPDLDRPDAILAKSARPLPRESREHSGLPAHWRHEALSVRLAPHMPRFAAEARDPELVLWLIGTHHGHGRPFFPHGDPDDAVERKNLLKVLGVPALLSAGAGPQSLAFDWNGLDWPSLYEVLKARYGVWELARMEAVLRLADHRTSEMEERSK